MSTGPVRTITYNVCGAYHECQYTGSPAQWTSTMADQVSAWDARACGPPPPTATT